MKRQQLHPEDYRALKTATRLLVQAVGGLEAAASASGAGTSRLAAYYDPNSEDDFAPIWAIADLERVAGRPYVTTVLARLQHHALLPLPTAQGEVGRAIGQVLCNAGRVGKAAAEFLADGKLDDSERARLADKLAELSRAASLAQAVIAGPRGPLCARDSDAA